MANMQLKFLMLCVWILDIQTAKGDPCLSNLRNIAVREGQTNIILSLSTDPDQVKWKVLPTSNEFGLQTIIDVGGNWNPAFTDLYELNQTGLIIENATTTGNPISTAGLYVGQCANDSDRTGAKLLVIRTGPTCSRISVTSTSSNMSCSIIFADSILHPIRPTITWKRDGANFSSSTPLLKRIENRMFYAESNITVSSRASARYSCEATFNAPTDIQYFWIATNAPAFSESCSASG